MYLRLPLLIALHVFLCNALPYNDETQEGHTQSGNLTITAVNPNDNSSAALRVSTGDPICFEPGARRPTTTIASCRQTLRMMSTFKPRYQEQEFTMGSKPKQPHPPPFGFHAFDSDCIIEIYSSYLTVSDRFSWEQVRVLAQQILQDCQDQGLSAGGRASIGNDIGWQVVAHGCPHGPVDAAHGCGTTPISLPTNETYMEMVS